jgi:hypothetical protein
MLIIKSNKKPTTQVILGAGDHLVRIDSFIETFNKDYAQMPWMDKTPQVAIRFKNDKGVITQWVNLKGYMTIEDYEDTHSAELSGISFKKHPFSLIPYAVDLDGNRIENEDKTRICMHILGRIAHCCGFSAGEDIDMNDLIGKELVIRVQKVSGQLKVTHTFKKM